MTAIDYILNTGAAYDRFRIAIKVASKVMAAAPNPVSLADLEKQIGCPFGRLVRVCEGLSQAGILTPASESNGSWAAGRAVDAVTLADILCCEIEQLSKYRRANQERQSHMSSRRRDIEVLVMQATMQINQAVLGELRRFSLDRLNKRGVTGG